MDPLLTSPDPEEAARAINAGRRRGAAVVVGLCEVHYRGRAEAHLPPGRRLLVLKRDGTLLVHDGEKAQPRMWNPPGSSSAAYVEDGQLVVKSVRSRPLESVVARFLSVDFVGVFQLDSGGLELVGSERDMVEALRRAPHLLEEGLEVVGVEVPTSVGHIDILARDRDGAYVAVEVKRDVASHEAVFQLRRYVEELARRGTRARGILAAPDVTASAMEYLRRYRLKFVKLNPRELTASTYKNPRETGPQGPSGQSP